MDEPNNTNPSLQNNNNTNNQINDVNARHDAIKEKQKKYSVEEAKNLGVEELQKELDNEIENKEKIVNKIINVYEKEDGIEVYVTYEVLEDIGTNEKIVF